MIAEPAATAQGWGTWPEIVATVSSAIAASAAAVAVYQARGARKDEAKERVHAVASLYYRTIFAEPVQTAVQHFLAACAHVLPSAAASISQSLDAAGESSPFVEAQVAAAIEQFNQGFYDLQGVITTGALACAKAPQVRTALALAQESLQDEVTHSIANLPRDPERYDFRAMAQRHCAEILRIVMENDPGMHRDLT